MRTNPPRRQERAAERAAHGSDAPRTLSSQEWIGGMAVPDRRMISDYNRGIHPAARAAHFVIGSILDVIHGIWKFLADPIRVHWAVPAALATVGFLIVFPWDGAIMDAARSVKLGGDVRREFETWQQYGQGVSMVFAAALIAILDAPRRRRLLDLAMAALCTGLVVNVMKTFIGRPRPKFNDPEMFLWPTGIYPVPHGKSIVLAHAYEVWKPISSDLWSMPSSHTVYAVALSIFLAALYPKLKWLVIGMAVFVGSARVMTGAHWPTDVIVGAAVGYIFARPAVYELWGTRAVDAIWKRYVNRDATPALPQVLATERERDGRVDARFTNG